MPKRNQQKYFNNWEYTSPQTLKLECHVAEEILQYNKNLHITKVQMAQKVINALDPCTPREPNHNNMKEESGAPILSTITSVLSKVPSGLKSIQHFVESTL